MLFPKSEVRPEARSPKPEACLSVASTPHDLQELGVRAGNSAIRRRRANHLEVAGGEAENRRMTEGRRAAKVERRTVDLSGYPDLVVIYLGMRVNALRGLKTLIGFGPRIAQSVEARPDGLLLHENFLFSLVPPHAGMRQYWRDFESLERWARSAPHQEWWQTFIRDSGGTGFWHETYFMRGGMEAVYDDLVQATGFLKFAPVRPARGAMFSARERAGRPGHATVASPVAEHDI